VLARHHLRWPKPRTGFGQPYPVLVFAPVTATTLMRSSFNVKLRNEFLKGEIFYSARQLEEERVVSEDCPRAPFPDPTPQASYSCESPWRKGFSAKARALFTGCMKPLPELELTEDENRARLGK